MQHSRPGLSRAFLDSLQGLSSNNVSYSRSIRIIFFNRIASVIMNVLKPASFYIDFHQGSSKPDQKGFHSKINF